MNEHQRMHYLDAMGIDMFVPRWRLPNANNSLAIQFGDPLVDADEPEATATIHSKATNPEAATPVEVPAERHRAPGFTPVGPVAAGLIAEIAENDNRKSPATAASPQESLSSAVPGSNPSGDDAEAIQFSLEIWQPQGLLVVDSHQVASGLPTAALLFNLLRHLGYNTSVLPGSELIHWPMVDLPHKPKSLQAAREMMVPLLDAKLLRAERGVLLFGKDVFRVIGSDDALSTGYSALCYHVVELSFARRALVLPSLVELLRQPHLKPLVWQALQQLL